MKKGTKWTTVLVLLIVVLAVTVTIASAAILSSGSFRIKGDTLSGAQAPGGRSSSANYQLVGAWGGMQGITNNENYSLCIGSICITESTAAKLFLPLIVN